MWQDRDRDVDSSHDGLIQDYLENELVPDEEKKLRLLLRKESFCRRLAQFAIDLGQLHDLARQGMLSRMSVERPARSRRRVVAAFALTAAVLFALGTVWLLAPTRDRTTGSVSPPKIPSTATPTIAVRPAQHPIARVVHVTGKVVRADRLSSAQEIDVATAIDLFSGDALRTVGEDSFAILEFPDASILAVTGGTELKCTVDSERKCVTVTTGDLLAQVSPQPVGKPLLIETPVANAEVLGTKLSLSASDDLTELAVLEGEVHLYRPADGQAVNVQSGQGVTASAHSDLVSHPLSPVSSLWEADFENGVPRDWRAGELVHDSLPPGSRGALRAVQSRGKNGRPEGAFRVCTVREWTRGLFRIQPDTHLNFTCKRVLRGGLHVRLNTSTDPPDPSIMDIFEYRSPVLGDVRRGEWQTVSVPLLHFRRLRSSRLGVPDQPPRAGHLAVMVGLGAPNRDPGLVVDRIWVTHGAPASCEVPVEPQP